MGDASLSSAGDHRVTTPTNVLGTVLSGQANYYWVRLDPGMVPRWGSPMDGNNAPSILLCTRRSRLKKIGQTVRVGDRVRVEEPDWVDGRGAIADVLERTTELDRPPIANANQIFLLFALAEPELDPMQLSRFLVKAESTGLGVCLGFNKSDLVDAHTQAAWGDRLKDWGYTPLVFSMLEQEGIEAIHHHLKGRMTVVSGPSGVGKSSLINALIPSVELRVGHVSGKLGRGRHTTRHVELFELPTGGLLADTPGFNQPDLDMAPAALAQCFPEVRQRLAHQSCHFSNCLHRDEPNCAVRGEWDRYSHYLSFLDEAIAHHERLNRQGDEETTQKVKMGESGEFRLEPKLESKRYRQPSRRTQRQSLQHLYRDLDDSSSLGDAADLDDLTDD